MRVRDAMDEASDLDQDMKDDHESDLASATERLRRAASQPWRYQDIVVAYHAPRAFFDCWHWGPPLSRYSTSWACNHECRSHSAHGV